jgi:glycosyltransferase involved in cell wall biosynthesis
MVEPSESPRLQGQTEPRGRLLVVSHPAVLGVNQLIYRELAERGWQLHLIVPRSWQGEYSREAIVPEALPGLEGALHPIPVALSGRPQRHLYLARCRALARRLAPSVAFLELEAYALAATQWRRALAPLAIPFGVQAYENIDRPLPAPVGRLRSRVLADAAFVAARSETAATLVRRWGAGGEVGIAPPAVPGWPQAPEAPARSIGSHGSHGSAASTASTGSESAGRAFTIGFAGRLIPSKGLHDLLAAVRRLQAPVELLLIGNGELRDELEGSEIPGSHVSVLDGLSHEQMADGYRRLDVLALPSHTTPTWKEQFGRVIIEALWCGVPVVGSDSGEIPWLIGLTGGGLVFEEGDVEGLAAALAKLRDEPELRAALARSGRETVERMFTVPAATDALERLLLGARRGCDSAAGRGRGEAAPCDPS